MTYTFVATSTMHFMQIEINESGMDSSIGLTLDFFHDIDMDGVFDGGDGGTEDLGLDYVIPPPTNPDFSGMLAGSQNQDVFEWFFTVLTVGEKYGVSVSSLTGTSDGAELITFSGQSVAIPEASSFLFFGSVALVSSLPWLLSRKRTSAT